ncbi:MAG: class I SAM-dependent methyltransferase [Bacteroidales bacterium]|jgi:cyclopropane fatty-acyl-phospholipid synthase-like methyltransferase|nr:class I SAM-dependent methyltransferase [Bacteroidales bacterium]
MPTFTPKDIADYYNQTLPHYRFWWKMKQSKAIHYGIWDAETSNFQEALHNTNHQMAALAGVEPNSRVMDAGCGVGGAAFFLALTFDCKVDGISLSNRQVELAKGFSEKLNLQKNTHFRVANYNKTPFEDNRFDLIWACESLCYANDKDTFLAEAHRLLKPSGKIVLSDYFLTKKGIADEQLLMKSWGETWAISRFNEITALRKALQKNGFALVENKDFSEHIYKSSRRMYRAYLIGALPSKLYNLTHNTSRFAKHHYLSGKFQFLALKEKLWEYRIVVVQKVG